MAIYPNEVWPAESTVLDVDATIDARTGLPFIAKGTGPTSSPSYEIQYNRRQMRENSILASWRQGMVVAEGGLQIGVYPMELTIGGVRHSFAGATGVSVSDDASRVVYLDAAAALQVADEWPADRASYMPLAEVTAAGGVMTIEDRRTYAAYCVPPAERGSVTAFCPQVSSGQTALQVFAYEPPRDLVLDEVQVFRTGVANSASVDVKASGVSVLVAAATPLAGTVVQPSVSDANILASNMLSVHVTTDGSGSVTNLTVGLSFRWA